MLSVKETERHASPGPRPQPLAFAGATLWAGCWDDSRLYAIDPKTWSVRDQVAAPGKPFGMAAFGAELRVVIADDQDDRYFYRFVPGNGFDAASKTPCPDLTGSHLASDGNTLYLLQMANQRILRLDAQGSVLRELALPTRCAGIGFGAGGFFMISTDEEFERMYFASLDLRASQPDIAQLAEMPSESRGLAFDGTAWWTSQREANEIVSFAVPGGA
jgi:sugar lactone lactonase YvrE